MKRIFILLFLMGALCAQSQEWALMSPLKTGSDVLGCSFINEQHGMAVLMTAGDIIETRDGGATWRRPWIPTISGNLFDIEFVTEDTLFTCGSNGGLWRSIDGGNSWVDQNPSTTEYLYQLHFVNSQLGFCVGFNGVILRTGNGGDTWQVIPSGTTNRLWGIEFVNPTTGFIAGWNGTVLKTTDAGLTWTTLTTGSTASFQCTSFVSDQVGFVCGTSGTILKTTNGGQTWTTSVTSGSVGLRYIHFRTPQIGWAVGTMGAYFTTTNGGTTWNTTATLGVDDLYCGDYISSGASYLMGKHQIYKSTNDAASWTLIKNHVTNSSFKDAWFQDDLHGTVVGSVGVIGEGTNQKGIVQTSDGGMTWQIRNQGSGGEWYGVHFPTPSVGYVVGGNNLAKTTNGGTTWTYTTPYTISGQAVAFRDATHGSVGGSVGIFGLCNTADGGGTFTCGVNQGASAIQYASDLVGYAVHSAQSSTFFKTTDGGATWVNMPGMAGSNTCLHFLDENEGWVGSNTYAWHTVDGGLTWTQVYVGADVMVGMRFFTPMLGYIVDQGNNIFRTTDGGETWDYLLGTYVTMGGCYSGFFTENYCYVTSYQGDIYRAELGCNGFSAGNILGDDQWCEGYLGSLFSPQTSGDFTYEWTLPPGWTGAANSSSIQPIPSDQSGEISLTVTNACGLQSTVYYYAVVTPLVESNISLIGPSAICSEGSYEYSLPPDAAATEYLWQPSSQFTYTISGNVLTVTGATGNGLIAGRNANVCGASNYATINVTLLTSPVVSLNLEIDSTCVSGTAELSGGLPAGGTFSGTGVSGNVLDASMISSDTAEITYTYTAVNGCANSATDTIHLYDAINNVANLNGDCYVDVSDLLLFMESFGCVGDCPGTDFNNDQVVGVEDLYVLMGMMGL